MMSPHISSALAFERQTRHRHEAAEHRRVREVKRVRADRSEPITRRARARAPEPATPSGVRTGTPSPAH
jgi:hypothetical protein